MKQLLLTLLLLTTANALRAQDSENHLTIPDFTGGVNKDVNIPIYLTNSDEVVAAQFDVTLPFAMPSGGLPVLSNRSNLHSANLHTITTASNSYRVVVMSVQNNVIRGNSGLLLRLPMTVQDDEELQYPIRITNVVLTDKRGNNIATDNGAEGTFTISREDLPDLTVDQVTLSPGLLAPGGKATIAFNVNNEGTGATRAGWTEKIYMESSNGSRCYLGSVAYTETLAAKAQVSRSVTLTIPSAPHIDGNVRAVVEVVPNANTGELKVDQLNNTGNSELSATLQKQLALTANKTTVREGVYWSRYSRTYDYISMTLTRSGDWSRAESFEISSSVDNLLTCNGAYLPANVTIPAGSGGVTFRIAAVNDNIVRAKEVTVTIAAAHGYGAVSQTIQRVDDDLNPLQLNTSVSEVSEGQQLTITATRGGELTDDLRLELGCSEPYRFTTPRTIEIPAGQATGEVTLTAVNDATAQLDKSVRFTASATDYQTTSASLRLLDDDRPAITLKLSPAIVAENAGQNATSAIISRDRGTESAVRVKLTTSRSDVRFNNVLVVIPAGQSSVEVPIETIDNSLVDGERTVQLTASLYVEGSNSYAPSGDRSCATAKLQVIDDESPYLALTSRVNTVGEGSSVQLTVRRYVPTASGSLTVALNSSDAGVTVPATVTIPSGSYTATFTAQVKRNETEGDDRMVTFTANAQSIEPGELSLRISDRTLPDAVSLSVDYDEEQFYSGMPATVYVEIGNEGTAILPAGMQVDLYLATGSTLGRYTKSIPFLTVFTEKELAVGEVQKLKYTADVPQVVGNHWLYARLNSTGKISEFSTSNNITRRFKQVYVAAPFSVETIQADRESYLPGELVTVTGRMTGQLNGQTVRVSLAGNGQRTYSDTRIATDGSFKTQVPIDRSAAGIMTVQALALGQTEAAKTCQVNVWNMRLTADATYWKLNENYTKNGKLTLRNTSGKAISGITLTHSTLPSGCQLALSGVPQTLGAGQSAIIDYTVNPTKSMTGAAERFTLTARCSEGITVELPITYFCQSTNGNIALSPSAIRTTLLVGSSRQMGIKVTNYGLKATGPICINVPGDVAWLKSLSPQTLPSLEPGASTTVYLQFTHQKGMRSGQTYKSSIQLSPESGASRMLPIDITVTGIEYSQLDVYAHDVFSKAGVDKQHVSGVTVNITNSRTGKSVMTGLTDGEGHWMTKQLTQGTYTVTLSALRHKTVKRQLVIGPDEQQRLDVYLPYKAVVADFVSDIDMETGEYTLKSDIDVDSMAPQAVVVPVLPETDDFRCGSSTFDMTLTNVGQRAALSPVIAFPTIPGVSMTVTGDVPAVLYPQESYVLKIEYNGPEEGRHRYIATMMTNYSFSINGETFSEEDNYQMLVGCDGDESKQPKVVPKSQELPEGDDNGDDGDDDDDDGRNVPKTALPTTDSYFELTFEQVDKLTTGQTINAVLTVKNGQDGMFDGMVFIPQISGIETYEDSTFVFTVTEGEYSGMTKTEDGYQLAGNSEGRLYLQLTPTADAATDGPRTYAIGGQLAYISRGNAIRTTASLLPTELTVWPQGRMQLTYFIQRHFLSDDADTEETENTEPAETAILIQNLGATQLSEISIKSSQPEVVTSSGDAPLAYETLYSRYATGDAERLAFNVVFTQLDIDSLAAGQTATARWIYGSSETGHVRNLETLETDCRVAASVEVNGVKELVRTVKDMRKSAVAETTNAELLPSDLDYKVQALAGGNVFLVNEIADEQSLPDAVWPSDGSEECPLEIVSDKLSVSGSAGSYVLQVSSSAAGWVYGRLHDPTNGRMMLTKVVRKSDGKEMSAANFWQTDRTMLSDYTVLYENLLHFADYMEATSDSYELTFTERPGEPAQVIDIKLYTADGTEVKAGSVTEKPVVKAAVEFTRPMMALYYQYFMLTAGDYSYNSRDTEVDKQSEGSVFVVDLSQLEARPGLHTMTVIADKLKDTNRQTGKGTYTVSWTEEVAAKAFLDIAVGPRPEAGTVDKQSGDYDYGLMVLTATAAEGYRFDRWTENGVIVGESETLEFNVVGATSLRAWFVLVDCSVVVDCNNDEGTITGFASGTYSYGDVVTFSAVPQPGYVLSHWLCDGEVFSDEQTIMVTVGGNHTYTAVFVIETVGVREVSNLQATDSRWYTLQGMCVGKSTPTRPGLYIHRGRVVRVK